MNPINSVLSARTGIYAVDTLQRIDGYADTIDRRTEKVWREILHLLSADPIPTSFQFQLANLLGQIQAICFDGVRDSLRDTVRRARLRAAQSLTSALPIEYLTLALQGRKIDANQRQRVTEGRRATRAERARIEAQLLPVESQEEIDRIVYAPSGQTTWQQRMQAQTGLASPASVAAVIATSRAQGETAGQMAQRLLPIVQGNRVSARRIARTESARCSTESAMQTYENMGDLVIGYQINATMDWRVRPHHAARNGTIYYRTPRPGQESMLHMPRPPIEEDGTVAYNCRCYLSPVLTPADHIENNPDLKTLFTDQRNDIIPDPQTYEQWFAQASDRERRWAVGTRRLRAAERRLEPGESLTWASMINPRTGQLLPTETIQRETPRRRETRIAVVADIIAERSELHRQITKFGYLAPEPKQPTTLKPVPSSPPGMPPASVQPITKLNVPVTVPQPPKHKPVPQTPPLIVPASIEKLKEPRMEEPKKPKKPGKIQKKLKPIKRPAKKGKTAREIKNAKRKRK